MDTIKEVKQTQWIEEIFPNHIFGKELISRIYKDPYNSVIKKTIHLNRGKEYEWTLLQRRYTNSH